MGLVGFYWVLVSSTGFYWVLTGFWLVLLGFTGFLLGYECSYGVLWGFNLFNLVLTVFHGV